ncbi:hypothetical protein L0244_18060 [bacterium]|nr:hypothetical protein [bacterium]
MEILSMWFVFEPDPHSTVEDIVVKFSPGSHSDGFKKLYHFMESTEMTKGSVEKLDTGILGTFSRKEEALEHARELLKTFHRISSLKRGA